MFQLDIRSRQPLYEQLIEKLKELIINDIYRPDTQLPSVRILAQELTINPNTIQKAYRELENQGYIYSVPGKGNFVAPQSSATNDGKVRKMKDELMKIISEALYLGIDKKELISMINEIEQSVKGDKAND